MVCSKCLKLGRGTTTLATPGVKKKSEFYYGSPASASSSSTSKTGSKSGKSATLGQTGIGKSKLLSQAARNPYAQYSSSCTKCKTRVNQGHTFCQTCAFKADSCAGCGKANKKKIKGAGPTVDGAKYTLK
ncbi:hypothetical protein ACRALDRAFT_1072046 [Sodiomyces alcalophilus JCM 7366]|uniref:uncharacterized protein n=1 Tax=Sodiomyces alcalophilus JCM 7366 TaxID=591952 RepID=UPI0039B368E3